MEFEWTDEHGDTGKVVVTDDGDISIELSALGGDGTANYPSASTARKIAGALLRAAQHMDPLERTPSHAAYSPDRLT